MLAELLPPMRNRRTEAAQPARCRPDSKDSGNDALHALKRGSFAPAGADSNVTPARRLPEISASGGEARQASWRYMPFQANTSPLVQAGSGATTL